METNQNGHTGLSDLKDIIDHTAAPSNTDAQAAPHDPTHGTGDPNFLPAALRPPQIDSLGRSYATGKRKNAIARVWIKPGKGDLIVNKKPFDQYFRRPVLQMMVQQPLHLVSRHGRFDVYSTVTGGGLSGQAGAIRHGLARALALYTPSDHPVLKRGKMLTRDSRVVERKKYGRRKARRSFQFSKR